MNNTDRELVRDVLSGDRRAATRLLERHSPRAMVLAMRMLKSKEDAEEAVQDAFVRALQALDRFKWKSSFSTWLYRILYNVCLSRLEKKGDAVVVSMNDTEGQFVEQVPADTPSPDIKLEGEEFDGIVHKAIEDLPAIYASILTFFFLEDLSYDEIAAVTGLPLGTVKVRLFRARAQLRDLVMERLREAESGVSSDSRTAYRYRRSRRPRRHRTGCSCRRCR